MPPPPSQQHLPLPPGGGVALPLRPWHVRSGLFFPSTRLRRFAERRAAVLPSWLPSGRVFHRSARPRGGAVARAAAGGGGGDDPGSLGAYSLSDEALSLWKVRPRFETGWESNGEMEAAGPRAGARMPHETAPGK